MKGWVYVISNKAIPELVKVGYSSKDPEIRAGNLNNSGIPYPYLVEYEILVKNPYQIEQMVHKHLSKFREKKEWFRCSPEEAIVAIKAIVGEKLLFENYKTAERKDAEDILFKSRQKQQKELDDNKFNKEQFQMQASPQIQIEQEKKSNKNKVIVTNILKLPLRSGPSTDAKILGIVTSGQELEVLEAGEKWSEVKTSNDLIGYVLRSFFLEYPEGFNEKKVIVTNKIRLTLRSGPSTDAKILGVVTSGQELELIEAGEEWSKVKTSNDLIGYVLRRYLLE